jgi:hypothetical protein
LFVDIPATSVGCLEIAIKKSPPEEEDLLDADLYLSSEKSFNNFFSYLNNSDNSIILFSLTFKSSIFNKLLISSLNTIISFSISVIFLCNNFPIEIFLIISFLFPSISFISFFNAIPDK